MDSRNVRPHAHLWLSDLNERADLPRVIHPELDHGNFGPVAKLEQGQRQPDVIVEVAHIPKHPIAARQ